jgi:hypothetical protein
MDMSIICIDHHDARTSAPACPSNGVCATITHPDLTAFRRSHASLWWVFFICFFQHACVLVSASAVCSMFGESCHAVSCDLRANALVPLMCVCVGGGVQYYWIGSILSNRQLRYYPLGL